MKWYIVVPQELDPSQVLSRLEAMLGRPADQISVDEITPELAKEVLGLRDLASLEDQIAEKEEEEAVGRFRRNLDFNTGKASEHSSPSTPLLQLPSHVSIPFPEGLLLHVPPWRLAVLETRNHHIIHLTSSLLCSFSPPHTSTTFDSQIGKTISRTSRRAHAPRRPKKGWSLVVRPLGDSKDEAFVAEPDGTRRSISEDERLLLERQGG
jgi:hypothetical protein